MFAGLLAIIWTGTLLTTFVEIPKVTQIFVWRFAPNADLMGQILVARALVQVLARPRIVRSYAPVAFGLVCAGLGLFGLYFRNKEGAQLENRKTKAVCSFSGARELTHHRRS